MEERKHTERLREKQSPRPFLTTLEKSFTRLNAQYRQFSKNPLEFELQFDSLERQQAKALKIVFLQIMDFMAEQCREKEIPSENLERIGDVSHYKTGFMKMDFKDADDPVTSSRIKLQFDHPRMADSFLQYLKDRHEKFQGILAETQLHWDEIKAIPQTEEYGVTIPYPKPLLRDSQLACFEAALIANAPHYGIKDDEINQYARPSEVKESPDGFILIPAINISLSSLEEVIETELSRQSPGKEK